MEGRTTRRRRGRAPPTRRCRRRGPRRSRRRRRRSAGTPRMRASSRYAANVSPSWHRRAQAGRGRPLPCAARRPGDRTEGRSRRRPYGSSPTAPNLGVVPSARAIDRLAMKLAFSSATTTRGRGRRRVRARGGAARLPLGLDVGGLGRGRGHDGELDRGDDRADRDRHCDHADACAHAGRDRDDRRDARPALGRPRPARPRHLGAAGRRGLARRPWGSRSAARASTSRSSAPPSGGTVEHHGEHYDIPYSGDGATGLGKPLKLILKRSGARCSTSPRSAKERRARGGDRRGLAADLLLGTATARSTARRSRTRRKASRSLRSARSSSATTCSSAATC